MSNHQLRYKQPANPQIWEEALPLGNGSLGAMIYGGVDEEVIKLNEESVWYGAFRDRINPDAGQSLEKIRSMIFEGKLEDAENLAYTKMFGTPMSQGHYEPLADLKIVFNQTIPHHSELGIERNTNYTDYERRLNLKQAIYECDYQFRGKSYQRQAFISYPDQVMAIRLSGDHLSFRLELERFDMCESIEVLDDKIVLSGVSGGGGSAFTAVAKVISKKGHIKRAGASLIVENTDQAIILIAGTTNYKTPGPVEYAVAKVEAASKLGYESLKERHIKDYKKLYDRVDLYLEDNEDYESTDDQLESIHKTGQCNSLMNLFFNYGRYLLIASSRQGSLPANLQGIWNHEMMPPWGCKYTININTQMNYWPSEVTNLSECQIPLFEHMKKMAKHGEIVAKRMYKCRGIMAHHNTDIYGDCAPQDQWMPATIWPMGMAWLSTHLVEQYYFKEDLQFIEDYYHILHQSVLFLLDFLIKDEDGHWVTNPTTSPENTYVLKSGEKSALCFGPTMDSQIIRHLFEGFLEISKKLGNDDEVTKGAESRLKDISKETIGSRGQILEWTKEYEEWEKGHRHISHLYGLYPGNTITEKETPEVFEAAKTTLQERLAFGGGHTGWSRAWIINFYARLRDSQAAYGHLLKLLQKSTARNLFDMHPPFQIDGNFGATAGIAEMLLQSHEGFIRLLPALPEAWANGHVKGLKARGDIEVNISWKAGKLVEASFLSSKDKRISLQDGDSMTQLQLTAGEAVSYRP